MYAATAPFLLARSLGLARYADGGRRRWAVLAIVGAAGALHTFYYTGFALAGLFVAALLVWPRRARPNRGRRGWSRRRCSCRGRRTPDRLMLSRTTERTGGGGFDSPAIGRPSRRRVVRGDVHAPVPDWWALLAIAACAAVGAAVARPRGCSRGSGSCVLPVLATLVGAAVGAQAHMFAPRYVIGATPFLVLGAGWAWRGCGRASALLAAAGALVLVLAVVTHDSHRGLQPRGRGHRSLRPCRRRGRRCRSRRADDLVVFNILSLAGAYERHHSPDAPDWTYAQVWDPVREPEDLALHRVSDAVDAHPRLWLVLYRGTRQPGQRGAQTVGRRDVVPVGWLVDRRPALPELRGRRSGPLVQPGAVFGGGEAELVEARYTSAVDSGDGVGVELVWRSIDTPRAEGKVFVHLYDAAGALVAQHDSFAAHDTRPASTWAPGETIPDRHGLMPPDDAVGPFTLVGRALRSQHGRALAPRGRVGRVRAGHGGAAGAVGPKPQPAAVAIVARDR